MHTRLLPASALLAIALQLHLINAAPFPGVVIEREKDLSTSYDYVVVGGGLSGLVVANRLTEDPTKTVLVIEAGILFPDDSPDNILIPGFAPQGSTGLRYDWKLKTQSIEELKDKTFDIAAAKIVGGGSAINGMFFDRGSKEDYDSWEHLGNKGWNWDGLLPYFKRSETFHPPDPAQALEFGIDYDPAAHGTTGPVQASFGPFIYPQYKAILDAMKSFGIDMPTDGTNGNAIGALWIANSLDPAENTRSYAKIAYNDISAPRSNYHLITQQQVTKILFDDRKRAIGVMFSAGADATPMRISARIEVIIAAGALHTPKLLQLSGIGPRALLRAHNIPIIEDLPGVGSNLQDHPAMFSALGYTTVIPEPYIDPAGNLNPETLAEYRANRTGPYTTSVGNTASFLPLPLISSNYESILAPAVKASASHYLRPSTDPTVVAGFAKQKQLLLDTLATHNTAVLEFIIGADARPLFAFQKPLSRGFVEISSADPFTDPLIQPRTISNPVDLAIVVESIKYARQFMASPGMAKFEPVETAPGMSVVSDEALAAVAVEALVPTFQHPSCSCPMMKRAFGGVVDDQLRVYGVRGLRIVDASIIPIIPGSHLQSTVYAIAEKAADLIKGV